MRPFTPFLLIPFFLFTLSCAVLQPRFTSAEQIPSLTAEYEPQGTLLTVDVPTSVDGPTHRRMVVYLPESYNKDTSARYPVLYLMHGAKGTELSWVIDGHVCRNIDSLVRIGAVREFILVLPNMNYYKDDADYGDSRFKAAFESFFEVDGAVETAFCHDVVAYTDSAFRTIPEKRGRALAGLSIGGLQSINISATHPDMFDYIGLLSPLPTSFIQCSKYSSFFSHLEKRLENQFQDAPHLYSLYIGQSDFFHGQVNCFCRKMSRKGRMYEYYVSDGGHDWYNWEPYSILFIQKLWK